MKKFFMFLAAVAVMAISANIAAAQDQSADETAATEQVAAPAQEMSAADLLKGTGEEVPLHQAIKTKFIEGGAGFMSLIIICLIIGLALAIERILYLSFSKTNTKKLLENVEAALAEGGVEKAKDVCRETRGPVASIFYQGLLHYDQGIDTVEKTIVSYGGVQSSLMENGLSWIGLFIALAPSLGFLGTVIGMVQAFDAIQAAGDISPNIVAGGMKVALITTVAGLIVAMILQVFYNYILSRIDSLAIDMEDSSISFIDVLTTYQNKKSGIIRTIATMYAKIAKYCSWALAIIGVIILIWGSMTGFESNGGTPVDVLLRWGYILLGLAVAAVLFAAIVIGGMNNPKGLVKAGIALVAIAVVCLVVYLISAGNPLVGYIGEQPDQQTLKLTDTLLNLTYILAGGAIVSIVVGEVISAVRNK